MLQILSSAIQEDREFRDAVRVLREAYRNEKPLPLLINGLSEGASDAFLAEILREGLSLSRNALVLVKSEAEARHYAELLSLLGLPARYYPKRDFNLYPVTASHELERERLSVLHSLLFSGCIAVATPDAAMQYTMPKEELLLHALSLKVGDECEPMTLAQRLLAMGFSRVESVEGRGQFALRGGIFDLFLPDEDLPVRMEFFGDEIDRMGHFDPVTQRIFEACSSLSLLPAREVPATEDAKKRMLMAIEDCLKKCADKTAKNSLTIEKNAVTEGLDLAFTDKYITKIYDSHETLLHYLLCDGTPIAVFVGTKDVKEAMHTAAATAEGELAALYEDSVLPKGARFSEGEAESSRLLSDFLCIHLNQLSVGAGSMRLAGLFGVRSRATALYGDNRALLFDDLENYRRTGYRVLLSVENATEAKNLTELLTEGGFHPIAADADFSLDKLPVGGLAVLVAPPFTGYELLSSRIAVITESAVKKEKRTRVSRRVLKKSGAGDRILSYSELREGDYVVHDTHGIGRFVGMEPLTVGGVTRDYVTIAYQGVDKIHIPADKIETISRYIGARAEDGSVKLSKLGGTDWFKKKERARGAAKEIAKELLSLYAERKRRPGHAFPPDGELEREFDAGFGYEETEPQLTAIAEIKSDMMQPCPMDRLLCGDVGFGKTEVALRAAFKAIAGGKQAAILVPTTILALQHYETALSRMRGFPVTVEMLSRFRTPKEQAKILRRLQRGEIDLIIGTHALLGKSVAFRELGLLIVDEEQRFGVSQKEKLKKMSTNVDVLTLTATPIPRTLNMAMSGIRDMSILDEAPTDRFPVITYVLEKDELLLCEAMRRELRRRGQVLYLYNKVDTIDLCAARIRRAIPEARVVYAHGQMEHDELEEIWQALVRGDIDILVCTTIIETGVDLPNANTLIIENADRMGLSQLHQIRGRVGRSGRQAYAYFTYKKDKALSDIAKKRLAAIRDFAEFGAGFRIALRDLEIRGAGNLLGAEQHGHIDAVGYEMYVRLLNEAILDERGEARVQPFAAKIEIRRDALIPDSYIASSARRLEMYKKISLILTDADRNDVLDELCDRFGEPPTATLRLLDIALLHATAVRLRIPRVEEASDALRFYPETIDLSVWSELFHDIRGLSFAGGTRPYIAYKLPKGSDPAHIGAEILLRYLKTESEGDPK